MHLDRDLKMAYPNRLLDAGAGWPERVLRRLGLRPPFVLPWSSPIRMTGAAVGGSGVTLAHGRLVGLHYEVQSATRIAGTNLLLGIYERSSREGEPVCVGLPRERTLVRWFRVPADAEDEIETMLPHLLANELPLSLEYYSWTWTRLREFKEGGCQIAVYIARNDGLAEFLAPLREAGFNVVGLVPEGWAWAHAARESALAANRQVQGVESLLIRGEDGIHLVVHENGRLLFDATLDDDDTDWEGAAMAEPRKQFEDLLEESMPRPVMWPDELMVEAEAMPEAAEEPEEPEDPNVSEEASGDDAAIGDETAAPEPKDPPIPFLAASVAACAVEQPRLMVSAVDRRRNRGQVLLRTFGVLGRLFVIAALAWIAYVVVQDHQTSVYLEGLQTRIAGEEERVGTLEVELRALRESNREKAQNAEILRALTSLRATLAQQIYLEHVNYVQGRGITLRGGAPNSALVFEMTDRLAADPLWQGLRVTQLRSEQVNQTERVHFEVEGRLE